MWNGNGQSSSPIVQVKDVVKRFHVGDGDVTILKGISLDIMPGEFVAIVGPSGNGKSTLLNMMTGIDHPSEGQVIVTGQSVHTMSENELAVWRGEHLGIIFQFFQLLPSRHIEVKGRAKGQTTITVTRNEILYGLNQTDKFILAVVMVDGEQHEGPFYVRQPFTQEPDWAVTSINLDLDQLLARAASPKDAS